MIIRKVLIVDDDPVVRHILHSALRAEGFVTIIAADAMGALSLARTQQPDLILLDLGLPAGGGLLFLQRLRQFPRLSLIPVIVISGLEQAVHQDRALLAGATAYLPKPVQHEEVMATVHRVLAAA